MVLMGASDETAGDRVRNPHTASRLAHGGSHDVASPFSTRSLGRRPSPFLRHLVRCGRAPALDAARGWPRRAVWQALCFACGWILLVIALVSPMHWLGERIFAVHMLEHEILMTLAAPLLVLASPVGGMLWALPGRLAAQIGGIGRHRNLSALALSHRPARRDDGPRRRNLDLACSRPLRGGPGNPVMHGFQHVSFFGSALLFWWALLQGRTRNGAMARRCSIFSSPRCIQASSESSSRSHEADLPRSIGRRGRMGPDAARGSTDGRPHHVGSRRHRLCGRNTCDARNLDCAIECHVLTGRAVMPLRLARLTIFTLSASPHGRSGGLRDARSGKRC